MIGSDTSSITGNPSARRTLLHLAPHPDDELMGGPAIMLALQASGHRIINLACSLGRPADRERREAEARESSRRTGFELIIPSRPAAIGSGDDLDAAQAELATLIAELVRHEAVDIVFSPSPHDRHPGHEVVGRAALDALTPLEDAAPVWWMWGLWADLPFPTLITYFGPERLRQILEPWTPTPASWSETTTAAWCEAGRRPTPSLAPSGCSASAPAAEAGEFAELATEVVLGGRGVASRQAEGARPGRAPGRAHARAALAWLAAPSLTQRFGAPPS